MNTRLSFLDDGERFSIPALVNSLRDLVVLRSNHSAVLVTGEEHKESGWVRFTDRFAPATEVQRSGETVEVFENSSGVRSLNSAPSEEYHAKRGRKSKTVAFKFPDTKFKMKDIAEQFKLPYHAVSNAFNKERHLYAQVGSEPNGGRGKPLIIWQRKKVS